MRGYNESKLVDMEAIQNVSFYNTVLTKAKKAFLDTKKIKKRDFFQTNLENTFQTKKDVLLNAMNLCI